MGLQLLLDSADPKVWEEWIPSGLFTGITTNPTLLRRAGYPCRLDALASLAAAAEQLGVQMLHLQSWGRDADSLAEVGNALGQLTTSQLRIHVKLPVTREGSDAATRLIKAGIPVTFTACFEVEQVLIAASLGAAYIAPYLGRINDEGRDGHAELVAMQACLDGIGSSCRLLVASLRERKDLSRLAAQGLNTFTISATLAEELFNVSATMAASQSFEQDARS
ncbi:MAG: transaldolase family protein [Prochlorococcus sp.]